MNKSTSSGEVIEKTNSEIEHHQEIVPVEFDSADENGTIANMRTLSKSSIFLPSFDRNFWLFNEK